MTISILLTPDETPGPGERALLTKEGRKIALFFADGRVLAIDNNCPHAGGSLCNGHMEDTIIKCPLHGLSFDLRTGKTPGNPNSSVTSYPVRKVGDDHFLDLPDAAA
jgi:nitrite reductase/ring-hydroxylating ferredoxin subunit